MKVVTAIAAGLMLLGGCAARLRETQLERVAKDWCQTIRASQVIPVYPLTEDLVPGDVFLVTTPIPRQAEVYRARGFLALDQHKARLRGLDFAGFYAKSHGIGANTDTPGHWAFGAGTGTPAGSTLPDQPPPAATATEGRHVWPTRWWQAPGAFFPSYSFSVTSAGGISAAIPIQSVPISLGFMNTSSASGSVQLADPYVYGVSETELREKLAAWARDHQGELAQVARRNPQTVFLRVVNRVYLIGNVQVWLASAATGGASGAAGIEPPELELFETDAPQPAPGAAQPQRAGMARVLDALNARASAAAPGAVIKYAYATRRQVVASEIFRRPLVIGFVGLDYPIQPDGGLGEAVATTDTINGVIEAPPAIGKPDDITRDIGLYTSGIASMADADARALACDHAASLMPEEFRAAFADKKASGAAPFDAMTFAYAEYSSRNGGSDAGLDRVRRAYRAALRVAWDKFGS